MKALIIILIYLAVITLILRINYCLFCERKPGKRRMSGLKINGTEVGEGDTIIYAYEDSMEIAYNQPIILKAYTASFGEDGWGYCIGKVVFENGCFVVKEYSYHNYDWSKQGQKPGLLYEWITENQCEIIN